MDCTQVLKNQFNACHGRLISFIEICPDDVWSKKVGGFPVWQQIFHAFACYDLFVHKEGDVHLETPFGDQTHSVVMFDKAPRELSKKEVTEFAARAKVHADKFLNGLTAANLTDKQEALSSVFKADVTNMDAAILLSSHDMYHVGAGDAALRENGHKGVL